MKVYIALSMSLSRTLLCLADHMGGTELRHNLHGLRSCVRNKPCISISVRALCRIILENLI